MSDLGYISHLLQKSSGTILDMQLENLLVQKKDVILKKWFDLVIETYPDDTSNFYKRQKDRFANPVGMTILPALEAVLEELFHGMDRETLKSFLDPIIRIRAVQGFSPSQAIAFIFSLKSVIREIFAKEIHNVEFAAALLSFESKIDTLGLISFNIYMACREKIYELKANETKNRVFRAFERANLIKENSID